MKIIQPLRNLGPWYARQSRTVRDLIVMGAIGFPLYLLAVWYDALDLFLVYTNEPQSDAIDWLVILFVFLGVAAKIYSVRRTIDLQREVVARRKAQAEAHQMARHDVLTGLPNRRRFIEDFNGSVEHLPPGAACAMFVLDLDNFKPINDVYGHRLGDEVLKVISRRLTELAGGASVARLGGDEFGVTLQYQVGSDAPERLGAPDRSRAFAADPARRSVAPGRRQRRRRDLRQAGLWRYRPCGNGCVRQRCGGNHAAPRRHGDVLGEGRWPRALPLLRSQHGREIAPAGRTGIADRRRDHR